MSLIKVTEALIAERGFNDELLASLTAAIDADLLALGIRRGALLQQENELAGMQEDLRRRKEELATEFATRRASLTALIGEEGAAS